MSIVERATPTRWVRFGERGDHIVANVLDIAIVVPIIISELGVGHRVAGRSG
jgi:hypothetical protein